MESSPVSDPVMPDATQPLGLHLPPHPLLLPALCLPPALSLLGCLAKERHAGYETVHVGPDTGHAKPPPQQPYSCASSLSEGGRPLALPTESTLD